MQTQLKSLGKLALCLLLCLGVGYVGSTFTQISISDWYPGLKQPPGAPPPGAFAPIWTLLYVMMGVSLWWVGKKTQPPKQAYALFYLQLFFNMLWPFLFFGMQSISLGFVDILLIDITTAATICLFWKSSRPAALLLFPYFAWVLYATYLNFELCVLNPVLGFKSF